MIIKIDDLYVTDVNFKIIKQNEKIRRILDSNGAFQDFENPNKSGEFLVCPLNSIKGNRAYKIFKQNYEAGNNFNVEHNKIEYKNCLILRENRKQFIISFESYENL